MRRIGRGSFIVSDRSSEGTATLAEAASGSRATHLVTAWASGERLVLGQLACEAKSNEITAIARLLERLALAGALVTIAAMGCQTRLALPILRRGADYVLAVKEIWRNLHE